MIFAESGGGLSGVDDNELLFYEEYERFYDMAERSDAFRRFCKDAFGEDFSQDGFSDLKQTDRVLGYIPEKKDVHILDIGCGNGKMLGYLKKKTGVHIHGFDFSAAAIRTATELFGKDADFAEAEIGTIDYPEESFDLITSMDTLYFAPDIPAFIKQVMRWLKRGGVFFISYEEGDIMPRTEDAYTAVPAKALKDLGIGFDVTDITEETYELLRKKRSTAVRYQKDFEKEGNKEWYDMLMLQTDCASGSYEEFASKNARYIYVIRKTS